MSFEERHAWVAAGIILIVPGWYFANVLGQARTMPVTEIAYQPLLLWNIGIVVAAIVAATVVAQITAHIGARIGAEVAAHRAGTGNDPATRDVDTQYLDRRDERDADINRLGGHVGGSVLAVAALAPLGLAMMESEQFWIANALYACLVLAALTSSAVRIVAYRRGL